MVAPDLEEWVAERMQKEAAVLKERRKGREERLLAQGVDPATATAEEVSGKKRGRGRGRG